MKQASVRKKERVSGGLSKESRNYGMQESELTRENELVTTQLRLIVILQ